MSNNRYFNQNEATDYQKLLAFNDAVGIFQELIPIDGCKHYDASGVTIDGRTARIELKTRNNNIRQYDGLFIEDHKVSNLHFDYLAFGDEPIYLNFCNDGIALFNLEQICIRPKINISRTKSNGYECYEYNSRNDLSPDDATVYDNNYNLIQISQWKKRQKSS